MANSKQKSRKAKESEREMKLKFNEKQKKLLKKIVPHIDVEKDLTDDEIIEIGDVTGDYLTLHCLGKYY